jgi:hypothetical protein
MEQWSNGVLEYWKSSNYKSLLVPLLHHSTTPTLQKGSFRTQPAKI